MSYLTIKAFHIIFMVSWFAGLFYIFRLFVYHVENWDKKEAVKIFEVMERKLLKFIMAPALVLTLFFGIWMLTLNIELLSQPWMHIKLLLVLVLIGYHFYSYWIYKKFSQGQKILTSKQCRLINEVPTIILIAVTILAVTKPLFS